MRAQVELELPPAEAFDVLLEELAAALARAGLTFTPGADGGVSEGGREVGRVSDWRPGERVALDWRQADWAPDERTRVELRVEPAGEGSRATVEHEGFGGLLADRGGELAGWFASEVAAPLLAGAAPRRLGDWVVDRNARRPTGRRARETYADPVYHRPNFLAILAELDLQPDDELCEVGCGGGAFLQEALRSGCRARAVDHSPAMVRLARDANRAAIAEGRLEIVEASAEALPFPDASFSCAVMTGVLALLPDARAALAECRRVLREGGRFVAFTGAPELRGTPAAPEPVASRARFYQDAELRRLALDAGLDAVRVHRPNLEPHARAAGVPAEHVPLFAGRGGQLLLARRGVRAP